MGTDDRFSIMPRKSVCRDCGEEIYWAKMDSGKNWSINPEGDLKGGRVILRIDPESGSIKGRRLEREEAVPDGCIPRTPHFMTCVARPQNAPQGQGRTAGPRRARPEVPKREELAGTEPPAVDPEDIPF
jgi:hypothetical protein